MQPMVQHARREGREEQITPIGIDYKKPKREVNLASLRVTQLHTETCNTHAGGSTDARTGSASSEKGKIAYGPSQKPASKSSIPAAALAKGSVRIGPTAAAQSGAATLRQPAVGMSAHTLSCLVHQ